jgi:hypothetical protein
MAVGTGVLLRGLLVNILGAINTACNSIHVSAVVEVTVLERNEWATCTVRLALGMPGLGDSVNNAASDIIGLLAVFPSDFQTHVFIVVTYLTSVYLTTISVTHIWPV